MCNREEKSPNENRLASSKDIAWPVLPSCLRSVSDISHMSTEETFVIDSRDRSRKALSLECQWEEPQTPI